MEEKDYTRLIGKLARKIESKLNRQLEDIGITLPQLSVLLFVIDEDNRRIFQRDIEKEFSLSNPAVTGVLQRLESKGLVERRVSSYDCRCKQICPTEDARSLKAMIEQKRESAIKELVSGISEDDLAAASRVLEAMLDNLCKPAVNSR